MIAVAIAVGILAQIVADRLRLPSIVFLLLFGVAVGPDGLGWIDTAVFGAGLPAIVTVAVALILFEGGLQIHYLDLAAVGRPVRNLVSIGAVVTVTGATLASHYIAGFEWRLALLFGAIVSVTGPTVINPLLDRVHVNRRVDTILRGEGIVIDPIGAIFAVVVLELIVTAESSLWLGLIDFMRRMLIGAAIGLAGGWLLGRILRTRGLFPDELKNLITLSWVLVLFAGSEALAGESGLVAVVLAGMTVRREAIPQQNQLRRFKGELSLLFISILFILLSAHLPLSTLAAVGWSGVLTVLVLMWVVRPINVLAATLSTEMTWRERFFVMWVSPRGVVAISVVSFIAILMETGSPTLAAVGLSGADGEALLALVFMTISITVLIQGSTANPVSRLLGVHAESGNHLVMVGANALGRTVGQLLKENGWNPLLIDTNSYHVDRARAAGLAAVVGNSLDHDVLDEARTADAVALVSLTANQAINFLVAQIAKDEYHVPAVYPALVDEEQGAHEALVEKMGADLAFGRRIDVSRWNHDLLRRRVRVTGFVLGESFSKGRLSTINLPDDVLPILAARNDRWSICHAGLQLEAGDRFVVLASPEAETALAELFDARLESEPEPMAVP